MYVLWFLELLIGYIDQVLIEGDTLAHKIHNGSWRGQWERPDSFGGQEIKLFTKNSADLLFAVFLKI